MWYGKDEGIGGLSPHSVKSKMNLAIMKSDFAALQRLTKWKPAGFANRPSCQPNHPTPKNKTP
jgi:hypothetical protein